MRRLLVSRWVLLASMVICRFALADGARPLKLEPSHALKVEAVDEVVEANDRLVQACNRNAHRLDTLAVLMQLTIDGDGKVTAAEGLAEGDGAKVPAEAACLARVAKRLKFPATGTITRVAYPFMLVSQARRALSF